MIDGGQIFFFFFEGVCVLHGGLMISHAKGGGVSQMNFPVISKLYNFFGNLQILAIMKGYTLDKFLTSLRN